MASNPWTALRERVALPLTSYTPLIEAVGGEKNIQVFDRPMEIRPADMSDSKAPKRLQLRPVQSTIDFAGSNTSARFVRACAVEIFTSGFPAENFEVIEWLIGVAYANIYMGLDPETGTPLDNGELAPLILDAIKLTEADPERDLLDVDLSGWECVCEVVAIGTVSIADLRSWVAP